MKGFSRVKLFSCTPKLVKFHALFNETCLKIPSYLRRWPFAGFSWALRAPSAKIKPFLSIYFRFSTILHNLRCLFRKITSIGILLISLILQNSICHQNEPRSCFQSKVTNCRINKATSKRRAVFF